jgi:uncharacterized membrane protein
MVEHQTAIMLVAFGVWGLIFVVMPFTLYIVGKRRARS